MRRTTVLRAGLSAALLLSTVAAGLGTQASASDTSVGASPSAPTAQASSALITAMQRDLGLSRDQATARLKAETAARAVD
ncbi:S1 family peptidase, partial [Streptomyces sp. NPDC056785]